MTDAELSAHMRGFRRLPDGRYVGIYEMLYNDRIIIGTSLAWYDDGWCFDPAKSKAALAAWIAVGCVGEPTGWHKHINTGRVRPDGDPAREYINE